MAGLRERRQQQRRIRRIIWTSVVLITLLVAAYFGMTWYFTAHFYFRTSVNGLEVGGMTEGDAEQQIAEDADEYLLAVIDRDKNLYTIEGRQIGASYSPDGAIGKALKEQNPFLWWRAIFEGNKIDVTTPMECDSDMLQDAVAGLACFSDEAMIAPENARIEETEEGYIVVPETAGSQLILERVVQAVLDAVTRGDGECLLTDDMYVKPEITEQSPLIVNTMEALDQCLHSRIVYEIQGQQECLEGETVEDMLSLQEDYTIVVDSDKMMKFVQQLATKYNTYADVRKFQTTLGDEVEIGGGDYGWVIDKEAECEQAIEEILSGEVITREPVYSQRGVVNGPNDIGDTYIEIDYSNQHLYYYQQGELKLDSDFVSGNISKGNGSPDGIYKVVYKQSPAVLVGEDYESDVEYFVVFAYNVGIHDASWRSQFGEELYKTRGSHGCVNVPLATAEQLYNMVEEGTPVVAYYREPVELTNSSCKISNAYSYIDPETKEALEQTGEPSEESGITAEVEE